METQLKYFTPDQDIVSELCRGLGCHPLLASLLSIRGIQNVSDAKLFLDPGLENLTDPFELKDMEVAVQRIHQALLNHEKILIFGDFDADGVTATASLYDFLEYCDADVSWYIPHRIKEGYSLQLEHVENAVDQDIDLIVTVDCGITSHDAVELAVSEDIDVIITDHHEPSESYPEACAIVNPKRADCDAGLDHLAGVGVVFYMIMALRKYFREQGFWEDLSEPNLLNYLDLFTIGTIGDMVPLIGENRTLCIAGFKTIRQGNRPGLKSLAQIARLDIGKIDSDDISFKIVPRINAAGRVSHARICVSQLTDTDHVQTEKTASILDQLNVKRQKIEQQIVEDIEKRILKEPSLLEGKLLFLWDDAWDPSVLGIAASRLARKYHFPVILVSTALENAVGSGRSINGINIFQALTGCRDLLVKFGGHAMASGLTVEKDNLPKLSTQLQAHIQDHFSQNNFQKTMMIDAVLDFEDIDFDLAEQVNRLRPFGMANPEPLFMCKNVRAISSYIIGGSHRKMVLENADFPSNHKVEAFHFNLEDVDNLEDQFSQIVFRLKINKFKPGTAQIIIEDI